MHLKKKEASDRFFLFRQHQREVFVLIRYLLASFFDFIGHVAENATCGSSN
jgi:hypothetical protein